MAVLPTYFAAALMIPPLLILRYETLPPCPWPLAIAGLPIYLTTELKLSPLPLGLPAGGCPLEIGATFCLWETPTVDAMMKIFRGFDARKLPIKAIRWFGVPFLVEVEGTPLRIGGLLFPVVSTSCTSPTSFSAETRELPDLSAASHQQTQSPMTRTIQIYLAPGCDSKLRYWTGWN